MRNLTLGAALVVAGATWAGCSKTVTADDCEKFADHMTQMTVSEAAAVLPKPAAGTAGLARGAPDPMESLKQFAQAQRPHFVEQCKSGLPRGAYECMMRASSVKTMAECRGK